MFAAGVDETVCEPVEHAVKIRASAAIIKQSDLVKVCFTPVTGMFSVDTMSLYFLLTILKIESKKWKTKKLSSIEEYTAKMLRVNYLDVNFCTQGA